MVLSATVDGTSALFEGLTAHREIRLAPPSYLIEIVKNSRERKARAGCALKAPSDQSSIDPNRPIKMKKRVLMIEDDEELSSMVRKYLADAEFDVTSRTSVKSGLETLDRDDHDALILDLMLPDGDGFDVCRKVRSKSDIPILMLTARGEETDRIIGLELGADDYLPKPFNPRELLARLRAILRRSDGIGKSGATIMRFGRLEIDCDARTVRVDGSERDLTGYQFDLLCRLAENAGRVMSRDTLMNHLRGHDMEAFDRSIDVHISRLRAAIEDDPKRARRVITVRGVGYVFARNQD